MKLTGMEAWLTCLGIIAAVALIWFIGGWVLMILWNALLPYLVGAPYITHIQGIGLWIMLSIVGSFFQANVGTQKGS